MFGIHTSRRSQNTSTSAGIRLESLEGRKLMSAGPWFANLKPVEYIEMDQGVLMDVAITPREAVQRHPRGATAELPGDATPAETQGTVNASPRYFLSHAIARTLGPRLKSVSVS